MSFQLGNLTARVFTVIKDNKRVFQRHRHTGSTMMMSLTLLLTTLGLLIFCCSDLYNFASSLINPIFSSPGSSGQATVTQTPGAQSVAAGQTISIRCKVSPATDYCFNWYLQKPGQAPKLLVTCSSTRQSGCKRGTDVHRGEELDSLDFTCEAAAEESPDEDADQSHGFDQEDFQVFCCDEGQLSVIQSSTLRTINSPRALEHGAADAKLTEPCLSEVFVRRLDQFVSLWYTFGGGTRLEAGSDTRPILTVLPPSSEELQQGKATLMCLANKGFPSDWSLSWKVDGSSSSWEEDRSPVVMKDGLYSWSSTLRLTADQWRKVGSVTCEATQGSQSPVSESLRRDQCSQY
nr:immunoglobulin kappa light chain-like [Nothobranchius furzeri]